MQLADYPNSFPNIYKKIKENNEYITSHTHTNIINIMLYCFLWFAVGLKIKSTYTRGERSTPFLFC